jgi:hypothetical protein
MRLLANAAFGERGVVWQRLTVQEHDLLIHRQAFEVLHTTLDVAYQMLRGQIDTTQLCAR